MFALTMFRSGITCLLSILALVVEIPSSVLYLTLHRELPKGIFQKKKCKEYMPKNTKSQQ
jgi:hypothetical protein